MKTIEMVTKWLTAVCLICFSIIPFSLVACSSSSDDGSPMSMVIDDVAMLKEEIKVTFKGVDGNTSVFVNFGDGTSVEQKASAIISHKYTKSGNYTISATVNGYTIEKGIHIYGLLALSEALKQFQDPENKKIWVMAHRSHVTDKTIPANSISAVTAAIATGVDVIECDTHMTSDGVLVVCHDQTIDATTNGSGKISAMTYEEILKYNMKDRTGKLTQARLPTLKEFLAAGRGKVYYDLDYSSTPIRKLYDVVKELGMVESVFFYGNSLGEVLKMNEKAHVYMWADVYKQYMSKLVFGPYFTQFHYNPAGASTPLGTALEDGMLVSVNMLNTTFPTVVPEFELKQEQLDGLLQTFPMVRMIQTDVPDLMIPVLKSKGLH